MSVDTISKATYQSLLPDGSAWSLKSGGDEDLLLDGMAENSEEIYSFLAELAFLRDPEKTIIIDELEKEYGLKRNDKLTDDERISRLQSAKVNRSGFGADFLEKKLQDAGFDLQVHVNNPPIDPSPFLFKTANAVCGNENAICGNENAVCSAVGYGDEIGVLIVNGDFFDSSGDIIEYTIPADITQQIVLCGDIQSICGFENALCGLSIELKNYWSLIFFVGGDVTRDIVTGEITEIAPGIVPLSRKEELKTLILQCKPTHSWAGLVVTFT